VTPVPDLMPPEDLRGRIMRVCTDDLPAGRAHRTSVAHRSGQFGHDGFPRPVTVARPRRVPKAAVAAAAAAGVIAVVAVLIVALSGGAHPARLTSSRLSKPTTIAAASSPVTDAGPSLTATPNHSATPKTTLAATRSPAPSSAAASTTSPATVKTGNAKPTPPAKKTPPPVTRTTSAPPPPTPSAPVSTPAPPPNPVLLVHPTALSLVSVNNAAASASITLIGFGATVHWTATVSTGGGHITIGRTSGTLAPGTSTTVTATASGTASFTAHITLMPGDHIVTVKVTAKKVVTKKAGARRPSLRAWLRTGSLGLQRDP
jgi:hypothetical protein